LDLRFVNETDSEHRAAGGSGCGYDTHAHPFSRISGEYLARSLIDGQLFTVIGTCRSKTGRFRGTKS